MINAHKGGEKSEGTQDDNSSNEDLTFDQYKKRGKSAKLAEYRPATIFLSKSLRFLKM